MQISPVHNNNFIRNTPCSFKGWSPESEENKNHINSIKDIMKYNVIRRAAISGHNFPDSDSISSSFAMAYLLNKKYHIPVDVFVFGNLPQKYDFLKSDRNIKIISLENKEDNTNLEKKYGKYDLAISMDTSGVNYINKKYYNEIFKNARHTVKIDHHKVQDNNSQNISANNYADINFVDDKAPSASQLVMQFVNPMGIAYNSLPREFNEAVYTGILADTGYFKYPNIGLAFKDADLLMKNGVNPNRIKKKIHQKIPKEAFDIVDDVMNNVKFSKGRKVAFVYVDEKLQKKIKNLNNPDFEFEINNKLKGRTGDLRQLKGVDITLLITRTDNNELKISSRSINANVREFAEQHNGGGHDHAAGYCVPIEEDVQTQIRNIVSEFQKI